VVAIVVVNGGLLSLGQMLWIAQECALAAVDQVDGAPLRRSCERRIDQRRVRQPEQH